MKFVIAMLAFVLAVVQVQCDMAEDMHKLDMACREETHISEDELKSLFQSQLKSEPRDAVKCHIKCVMEKQGHWKNGAFDPEATKEHLKTVPVFKDHQDVITKAVDECKDKKGANECDTAYLITRCVAENKSEIMPKKN